MQANTSTAFPGGDPYVGIPGFTPTDELLAMLPPNLREIVMVVKQHVYDNVVRFEFVLTEDGVCKWIIRVWGHHKQGRPVVIPLPDTQTATIIAEIVTRWRVVALSTPRSRRR